MKTHRPIPDWTPSTPEVRGRNVDDVVRRHFAVAIHFWAPWNGSDPPMNASILAIADRFVGRVAFYSCNVDLNDNVELCKHCRIANIPTLAIWVSGEQKLPIVGLREPDELATDIESRLCDAEHKA